MCNVKQSGCSGKGHVSRNFPPEIVQIRKVVCAHNTLEEEEEDMLTQCFLHSIFSTNQGGVESSASAPRPCLLCSSWLLYGMSRVVQVADWLMSACGRGLQHCWRSKQASAARAGRERERPAAETPGRPAGTVRLAVIETWTSAQQAASQREVWPSSVLSSTGTLRTKVPSSSSTSTTLGEARLTHS